MPQFDPNTITLDALLDYAVACLAEWGVPEEYRQLAVFGGLFLIVTLLVLLLVSLLLRRSGSVGDSTEDEAETPILETEVPASPHGDVQTEEVDVSDTPPPDATAVLEGPDGLTREPVAVPGSEAVEDKGEELTSNEDEALPVPVVEPEPAEIEGNLFQRLRQGLSKTQASLVGRLDALLGGGGKIDSELLEDLEEVLITADLGMQTTRSLVQTVEERLARNELQDVTAVRQVLREEMVERLKRASQPMQQPSAPPLVIMVVGVNGVGKTTTIGKLASRYTATGKKVLLGAGDTFRAAAAEQLGVWGERAGVDVIHHAEGADPGAVAFDAAKAAVARQADILILDTAGRLHTKANLMEELKKVRRVLEREIPDAPHETLLVLDATTGQNALVQARLFREAVQVDGLILTKLDGTARGGIVIAIANDLGLPVRFIGVGEQVADLQEFEPEGFVAALFDT